MRRILCVLASVSLVGVVGVGPAPAGAQTGPTVTVTPSTNLTDGQTVTAAATEMFWFELCASVGGCTNWDARALQCAGGIFPVSDPNAPPYQDFFDMVTAEHCVFLGFFSRLSGTTAVVKTGPVGSLDVAVHRAFTTPSGATVQCDTAPGACVILAYGPGLSFPTSYAMASAPISFRPPTPQHWTDCLHDGWRALTTTSGKPFHNVWHCLIWTVFHRR